MYVQSTNDATVSYYLDTFKVKLVALPSTPVTPVPPDPGTSETVVLYQSFEDGQTGGWVKASWMGDGTIGVTWIRLAGQ